MHATLRPTRDPRPLHWGTVTTRNVDTQPLTHSAGSLHQKPSQAVKLKLQVQVGVRERGRSGGFASGAPGQRARLRPNRRGPAPSTNTSQWPEEQQEEEVEEEVPKK